MTGPTDSPVDVESAPPDFITDSGDEYVRVPPDEFDSFDDVDATTISDEGAPSGDVFGEGGEH